MLEDRPTQDIEDPWGGSATLIEIRSGEVREAWEAARAEFAGRHPVVVCDWGGGSGMDPDLLWRRAEVERSPADLLASTAPPWAREDEPAHLHVELEATRSMFGEAPADAEVRAALGSGPSHLELERWLLDWERNRTATHALGGSHMTWFVPDGLPTYVLLTGATTSEEAIAYLDFWALEEGFPPARLAGLVRSWRERFGAQLVASWGTMLQFAVERPPADLEAAWAVAVEHHELAPDTMLLPGVPIREHARDLVGRGDWFLHQRP